MNVPKFDSCARTDGLVTRSLLNLIAVAGRLVLSGLLVGAGACGSSGLVGGSCGEGYALCDGACVDLSSDGEHCGSCGNACGVGALCTQGVCEGSTAVGAAPGSGGSGGSAGGSSSSGGVGSSESGGSGGGTGGERFGTGGEGGSDDPPTGGTGSTTGGGGSGSTGGGSPCPTAPFSTQCDETCVDPQTNAFHCGGCGVECPSGLCVDGGCQGTTGGHMVAICDDMKNPSAATTRLFSNAVFLSNTNPVRVLAYGEYTPSSVVDGIRQALDAGAANLGRSYTLIETSDPSEIDTATRQEADVVLVMDQPAAPPGAMSVYGTAWQDTLEDFVMDAGIVVVSTAGAGRGNMHDMVSSLGILSTSGTVDHTGSQLHLQSPGDAMAIGVLSKYLAPVESCVFETTDAPSGLNVFVTSDTSPLDGTGRPNTIHRIILE